MGIFLVNKTQNPLPLPYPFRGVLQAGSKQPLNLTEEAALTALALKPGQVQRFIGVERGATAPFNDLMLGDAQSGLLIGAVANPLPLQNVVFVESLADLPVPSGGISKMAGNTLYDVNGIVDVGAVQIEWTAGATLRGFGGQDRDGIVSSHAGAMIAVPAGVSSPISIALLQLTNLTGSLFSVLGAPSSFGVKGCTCRGEIGVFNSPSNRFDNVTFKDFDAGMSFGGGGTALVIESCSFTQTPGATGTVIDLGANVWTGGVIINENIIVASDDGIGLNGLVDNGNIPNAFGLAQSNIVGGSPSGASAIDINDNRWSFSRNVGALENSSTIGQYGFGANATATLLSLGNYAKIAGTTNPLIENRFKMTADNEIEYQALATATTRVDVSLTGEKAGGGSAEYQFTIFRDDGGGFVQQGAEFTDVFSNQGGSIAFQQVFTAVTETTKFDVRVRNLTDNSSITAEELAVLWTVITS